MIAAPARPKAFAVWFKDLDRWDVSYFRRVRWAWPKEVMRPIGQALTRQTREVDPKTEKTGVPIIEKISFGGQVSLSDQEGRAKYKGRLFWAEAGELVYSKIRVKQGSLAVVPPTMPRLAVSAEYPVYTINAAVADGRYLVLALKSRAFQDYLEGLAHGGSTKTRIHPTDFEALVLPLPPLPVQQAIVRRWQQAQDAIDAARRALDTAVEVLNDRLFSLYRRQTKRDVIHSRCFALDFRHLAEWDTKSSRAAAYRLACPSFRPMGEFIQEATDIVRPFDEPEKDWPIYGVNNKEGVFFNAMQKGKDFNAPYKRIRKDWFFHNPTRSAVGSLGIVPDVPADAVTSPEYQVWRVKDIGKDRLLPGYVAVLLQTRFLIDVVQFYRVGAVKQRMYVDNLCQVRLPYLGESEQRKYAQARAKALVKIRQAKAHAEQANAEVEEMILGTRPVEGASA